jgi:hypothetical protein
MEPSSHIAEKNATAFCIYYEFGPGCVRYSIAGAEIDRMVDRMHWHFSLQVRCCRPGAADRFHTDPHVIAIPCLGNPADFGWSKPRDPLPRISLFNTLNVSR